MHHRCIFWSSKSVSRSTGTPFCRRRSVRVKSAQNFYFLLNPLTTPTRVLHPRAGRADPDSAPAFFSPLPSLGSFTHGVHRSSAPKASSLEASSRAVVVVVVGVVGVDDVRLNHGRRTRVVGGQDGGGDGAGGGLFESRDDEPGGVRRRGELAGVKCPVSSSCVCFRVG